MKSESVKEREGRNKKEGTGERVTLIKGSRERKIKKERERERESCIYRTPKKETVDFIVSTLQRAREHKECLMRRKVEEGERKRKKQEFLQSCIII